MDNFDTEFVMELFLDTDSLTTNNRLVVAVANVINENSENLSVFHDILKDENTEHIIGNDSCEIRFNARNSDDTRSDFYEEIVMNYDDDEYIETFKMKKSTAQALIKVLNDVIKPGSTIIPLEKKLHVFLYLLTTESSFKDIEALFGIQKSSVSYIFHEMSSLLAELRYNFITWPSLEEQHLTRLRVNSRTKFPNCVGFIDACRFRIGSKRKRKDKTDIVLLQAVCDDSLIFIDVHAGYIGKTRKSKIFKESPLSQVLKSFVSFDNHIIGDFEYKLCPNLITPFTNDEILTNEEVKFNEVHWRARTHIGRAFELLKGRFKKLNFIDIVKPEYITTLLYAACTLHNFIILHEGCDIEIKEEGVMCDDGVSIDPSIVKTPTEKRQFLCNYINYIEST